jgi:hypothetical protein
LFNFFLSTLTNTHTHRYIYIYIYIYGSAILHPRCRMGFYTQPT